ALPICQQLPIRRCGCDKVAVIAWGMGRKIEVAASTRAHLTRKQSDQGQPRPLSETKRPKELLLGMLESRGEAINGRNRHKHLAKVNAMKVNCQTVWVKEDRRTSQKSEVRMQNAEVRMQKSECRSQNTEVRIQKSVRFSLLHS